MYYILKIALIFSSNIDNKHILRPINSTKSFADMQLMTINIVHSSIILKSKYYKQLEYLWPFDAFFNLCVFLQYNVIK